MKYLAGQFIGNLYAKVLLSISRISLTLLSTLVTITFAYSSDIDSLQGLLKQNIPDTVKADVLLELAKKIGVGDIDSGTSYATASFEVATAANYASGKGNAINILAWFDARQGRYYAALDKYMEVIAIASAKGDSLGVGKTSGNVGIIYRYLGDYPKSLEYCFRSLHIAEGGLGEEPSSAALDGIAGTLLNIGVAYHKQDELERAREYYDRSFEIYRQSGNKVKIANSYGNIANWFISFAEIQKDEENLKKAFDSALVYQQKALHIHIESNNFPGQARVLSNMGVVYKRMGNLPKALELYNQAYDLDKKSNNLRGEAIRIGNIGSLEFELGKVKEAEESTLKALRLATSIHALFMMQEYENSLSTLYEETGKYQLAYEHYKAATQLKDSLFNEDKSKEIGKLEAGYEFQKAEDEKKRAIEVEANALAQSEKRRNNLQYSGILIFLVAVFAGVFMIGRVAIPVRLAEGIVFFAFLLFFEFSLVLLDPYIEDYSSGAPAIKLAFNAILAALIFPLHSFFEGKMKARLILDK